MSVENSPYDMGQIVSKYGKIYVMIVMGITRSFKYVYLHRLELSIRNALLETEIGEQNLRSQGGPISLPTI